MKTQHTPGPWKFDSNIREIHGTPRYGKSEDTEPGAVFEGCCCNELTTVAVVHQMRPTAYSKMDSSRNWVEHPIRKDVKDLCRSRYEANARLIAAAPELLEALLEYKHMYEEVQPAGGWQGVYEIGNAAISKALTP